MIGRATRRCDDIGKERFRIFDAVDLYTALQKVTDMKPVVVNLYVSFEQLVKEIVEAKDEEYRRIAVDEFMAKLQRKKRALKDDVAERFQTAAGMDTRELVQLLKKASGPEAQAYFKAQPALASFLDRTTAQGEYKTVISERVDHVREVRRGYGKDGNRRPGDFLDSFRDFIQNNLNKVPALLVVTQRPRDLTRDDLRKLKLALDEGRDHEHGPGQEQRRELEAERLAAAGRQNAERVVAPGVRGVTPGIVEEARSLLSALAKVASPTEAVVTLEEQEAALARAEDALWAWYLEWSKVARVAIKQRAHLRQLGFLKTTKEDEEEPAEGAPRVPPFPPAQ